MAKRKRQHWMDEIIDSLQQRIDEAVPHVAAGIRGDVPFGYEPPKRDDEVRAFLNMDPMARQQLFMELGPDGYREWSESMMGKLSSRFGAAAQVLMPMLQGTPIETLAGGVSSGDDGGVGVAAAQVELTELLGFDPFAD